MNRYTLKKLDPPENGFHYKVENEHNLFAVISKQRNGKVLHDVRMERTLPSDTIEIAIIRPCDEEEEIIDYYVTDGTKQPLVG